MATKKPKADREAAPGPPQQRAALRKLAQVEASRMTSVPIAQMKRGKHPVAMKTTNKKKGAK